ncbi:MAG: helix-turn-helix transcriptional regulator, partial [Clostridia bacterium]|nr:helix-turn-helix transcriptional regulator [Clostridia bacterium]
MQILIKQIRAYLKMSQAEFAEHLNVTFASVNRWENGRTLPNKLAQTRIYEICKSNNVPVYDLTLERISSIAAGTKPSTGRILLFHGSK